MFSNILFTVSALLVVASAIMILVTKNIMHACLYLFGTLFGVAGLYVTLNAEFVAVVQLMVYVGGVVILMAFAIMLTGGKDFMKFARNGESKIPLMGNMKSMLFGGLTALVIALSLFRLLMGSNRLLPGGENQMLQSSVEQIGMLFLTDHVLAFEISSVLLLGALIGAAIIARPKASE